MMVLAVGLEVFGKFLYALCKKSHLHGAGARIRIVFSVLAYEFCFLCFS